MKDAEDLPVEKLAQIGVMHVRVWFQVGGGHTHLRVFVGKGADSTHAKAGDLCFDNTEWAAIRPQMERIGWEICPERSSNDNPVA